MEEKRVDLIAEKRKKLLDRLLGELSHEHLDLYYRPTNEIAYALLDFIKSDAKLNANEKDLLAPLTQGDIRVILSLK